MNSFVVLNCTFDGTSGSANPLCLVTGGVNGKNIFAQAFFRYLMAADAVDQMQAALTAVMFNFYVGYRATLPWPNLIPFPEFPESDAVAVHSGGPYPGRAGRSHAGADWIVDGVTGQKISGSSHVLLTS